MNLKACVLESLECWDIKTHKNDSASCSCQIHRSVQSASYRGA